ncbi:MAG: pilin [Candidatus Gracilibacteria bacterium]|jgi:hypothetical protein|nr:pilin [Candidatus Gracilibacteria bacterium]
MKKFFAFWLTFLATCKSAYADWSVIPGSMYDKFKTGEFTTDDIIEFAMHIMQLLIELAGVFAVLMIMIGGYRYVIGSFYDDTDEGKNTLKYSIIGFAVCILAWIIVEFIIKFLTT